MNNRQKVNNPNPDKISSSFACQKTGIDIIGDLAAKYWISKKLKIKDGDYVQHDESKRKGAGA